MLGTTLDVRPFLERVGQELLRIDPAEVKALADAIYDCYQRGRFVFVIGNGGSGSNASHFCEDLGKGTLRREDFDNDAKKRLRILSLTDNTPVHPRLGQRRGLRPRLRRAAQEPGQPGRPADRHQRLGQQPEHPAGGRVGQPPRPEDVRLHRLQRRQAAHAGPAGLARAARRHGHRRIDPPDGVPLGRRRPAPPHRPERLRGLRRHQPEARARDVARSRSGLYAARASQQLLRRDRQVANALAGRVVDGVGDGRRHADQGQLRQPLRADGVDVRSSSSTKNASSSGTSAFTGTW